MMLLKRLNMINWLKNLTLFRLLTLVHYLDYYTQKINEIEKKITDHDLDKNITTQEFKKLTADNFAARIKQANSATEADIDDDVDDLAAKADFEDKLKNWYTKDTLYKTKRVEAEKKDWFD